MSLDDCLLFFSLSSSYWLLLIVCIESYWMNSEFFTFHWCINNSRVKIWWLLKWWSLWNGIRCLQSIFLYAAYWAIEFSLGISLWFLRVSWSELYFKFMPNVPLRQKCFLFLYLFLVKIWLCSYEILYVAILDIWFACFKLCIIFLKVQNRWIV